MKKSIIYSTIFLIIFAFNNMMGKDLSEHKWKNRIVLVIANDSSLNQFNLQMEELRKDLPGTIDRKIVIYKILPNKYQIETTEEGVFYEVELITPGGEELDLVFDENGNFIEVEIED